LHPGRRERRLKPPGATRLASRFGITPLLRVLHYLEALCEEVEGLLSIILVGTLQAPVKFVSNLFRRVFSNVDDALDLPFDFLLKRGQRWHARRPPASPPGPFLRAERIRRLKKVDGSKRFKP
jgi:hypothetical protein